MFIIGVTMKCSTSLLTDGFPAYLRGNGTNRFCEWSRVPDKTESQQNLCYFITQPLFVLKTWEICFVVDLPAFNVLRQLTTRQAFNSIYLLLKFIYMDRDLNDKHFDFRFSTFSINDIYYDLNAKRTMSLTLLIAQLCTLMVKLCTLV